MSGNNNINMAANMFADNLQDTNDHACQPGQTVYSKEETGAESGWYEKIKNALAKNEEIPIETVGEIEKEEGPKIAALVNILGKHSVEQGVALAKVTLKNESLALQAETQAEHIGLLEEEKLQQREETEALKKSMEEMKRELAANKNFLQNVESSNRRLSEDLTEKKNNLGTAGKDKKGLEKLVNSQKKEIERLAKEVEHLQKEVAAKGGLVQKYEGERGKWARELAEQNGPLFRENKELKARVEFLEGELASSHQNVRDSDMELSSSRKTLHSTRDSTPAAEPAVLANEITEEEFGEEEEGEEVGAIDFQPPGRADKPALLHQLSGPSPSAFWSEGLATENGFSIPKALSAPADNKATVATGCLDACVQTEAAGPTVSSSAQTVGLEVLEASVQTDDRQSSPSEDGMKAPVQSGGDAVAPGAKWQGWRLVIIMLAWAVIILWGHKEDRRLWLEANGVSRDILVELRDSTLGTIPWLEVVSYNLITWLQPDRVFLG